MWTRGYQLEKMLSFHKKPLEPNGISILHPDGKMFKGNH